MVVARGGAAAGFRLTAPAASRGPLQGPWSLAAARLGNTAHARAAGVLRPLGGPCEAVPAFRRQVGEVEPLERLLHPTGPPQRRKRTSPWSSGWMPASTVALGCIRLTGDPSRSTVEPRNGGHLGNAGSTLATLPRP